MNRAPPETGDPSRRSGAQTGADALDSLPPADSCGDFGLRIARDGTWFYHGSPIGRKAITKLFASVLRREDDGTYWLVTPAERGRIAVDDVPFVAVSLDVSTEMGRQRLVFTTNLDDVVVADADHPLWIAPGPAGGDGVSHADEGVPYLHVRGGLNARLSRPVYYQLAEHAVVEDRSDDEVYGVWSDGVFFALAPAQERPGAQHKSGEPGL